MNDRAKQLTKHTLKTLRSKLEAMENNAKNHPFPFGQAMCESMAKDIQAAIEFKQAQG